MNKFHSYTSLFNDQVDSLYGFLLTFSIPLSDYCLEQKSSKEIAEVLRTLCYQSPFFMRMNNAASLVASDEKTRLVMRVTQDFLYGLSEIACQECACEQPSHDQKNEILLAMIQKYAQRIVSFCDLKHFEKTLPHDFKELFLDNLNDLLQKIKNRDAIHAWLLNYHDDLDRTLLIQAYIFVNYISCLKFAC